MNNVEFMSLQWFEQKELESRDILYRMIPDDKEKWEGLVSPTGKFFSCGFSNHNVKAWFLLMACPDMFGLTRKVVWDELFCQSDKALDILMEKGWAATREIAGRNYITLPKRPTKAQKEAIYDAAYKHHVLIDFTQLFAEN